MNNSKNWAILIIVLVVLGLGYWYFTRGVSAPVAGNTPATLPSGAPGAIPGGVAPGTQTGGPAAAVPGTGGPTTGRTYAAQVTITGFTSHSQTDFPLVNYTVDTALAGQGFFSLIGQNTNTVVWGKSQPIKGAYTLDPNSITVQENSPSHKLSAGDYFIRITDSSGAVVGESRPFRIAVGQVTNN